LDLLGNLGQVVGRADEDAGADRGTIDDLMRARAAGREGHDLPRGEGALVLLPGPGAERRFAGDHEEDLLGAVVEVERRGLRPALQLVQSGPEALGARLGAEPYHSGRRVVVPGSLEIPDGIEEVRGAHR